LNKGSEHLGYRPDIDGLRAIAVLPVVGFHAFPGRIPGGYVGVDVFFVISGFLITGIILDGLAQNRFSFREFYFRRIRRIFPALMLVLAFCLIAGLLILFPPEFLQLGAHVAAGAGFVANFMLWSEAGYFDAPSDLKPLLHLWSLGIEEQFYICWPLMLWLLWKPRWHVKALAALTAASFLINIATVRSHPSAAFFLPFGRIWELSLGALLACVQHPHDTPAAGALLGKTTARASDALSIVGLLMIVVAVFAFSKQTVYPGWRALVPTVGAVLLIACGPSALVNRHLLSRRLVVFIGLISYPLYLWHWPLFTFVRIAEENRASEAVLRASIIAAAALSFALAALTWRLVETPIRSRPARRSVFALGTSAVVIFACAIGFHVYGRFHRAIFEQAENYLQTLDVNYRQGSCFLKPEQTADLFPSVCPDASKDAADVMLWGDSHAAHLMPGIKKELKDSSVRFVQLNAAGCPPLIGFTDRERPACRDVGPYILDWIRTHRPATVILAATWPYYASYRGVEQAVETIKGFGVRRVIIMGPVPHYGGLVPRLLMQQNLVGPLPLRLTTPRMDELTQIQSALRDIAARTGAVYLSPLDLMCNRDGCMVTLDGKAENIMTFDNAHLTTVGSEFVVGHLLHDVFHPRQNAVDTR
jgi:peptidoglycan/LPS O-acetylase OafA/YrhL